MVVAVDFSFPFSAIIDGLAKAIRMGAESLVLAVALAMWVPLELS